MNGLFALLAATDVRITQIPSDHPDGLTKLTAWATVVAALGTFGAVAAALFLPRLEDRRKRPSLTVTAEKLGRIYPGGSPPLHLSLRIHNAKGKQKAEDVELRVSARTRIDAKRVEVVVDEAPILFGFPFSGPETTMMTIPPGDSRKASVLALSDAEAGADAYFTVSPRKSSAMARLSLGSPYSVFVSVSGANFNAMAFNGTVVLREGVEGDPGDGHGPWGYLELEWIKELQRIDEVPLGQALWAKVLDQQRS